MKSNALIATMLALASIVSLPAAARNPHIPRASQVAVVPAPITEPEAKILLWMREEEKLARDVYLTLSIHWGIPEFQRIANSEQRHFDAMGAQLIRFGLTDPALSAQGVFSQQELQDLYWQSISKGAQSPIQALTVGASIEDVDIADLIDAIDATTNPVLKRAYENLLAGSKQHLRVFVGLLRSQGTDYTPVHIAPALFDAIVGN
jgi:hypothetical protein